jgi:nucleoside permease NupC
MLIQTIRCFITDESGDMDALTVISLIIGFIAAIAMLNGTVVQLFAGVFGMLPVR